MLWRRFQGNEPSIPLNSPRACVLRLHHGSDADGEPTVAPSILSSDEKGPHWGKRTKPSFVCSYFVPNKAPYVKPKEKVA
jgi:hypothetical protein